MLTGESAAQSLRLGDILVKRGPISEKQLNNSLDYQHETGARLGEALIHLGYVTPERLEGALLWQHSYGLTALAELVPNPSTVGLLTEKFCRARHVLPLDFDRHGTLILAMADPSDVVTIDDVRLITGISVTAVTAIPGALEEAWDEVFTNKGRLERETIEPERAGPDLLVLAEYDKVVSLVEEILAAAVRQGASDIHFEPQADCMVVRIRVDGMLHRLTDVRDEMKEGVVSRIKILGDMDIAERRLCQDGRATFRFDDRAVDLRIASIPTVFGENVTIRLLDGALADITLEDLGMGEEDLAEFRSSIKRP